MIVKLLNNYFIETDPLNFSLKQSYVGETKSGVKKETAKTIGYYPTMKDALRRFLELMRHDGKEDAVISMTEYIDLLEKADKENRDFLSSLIGGMKFEQ